MNQNTIFILLVVVFLTGCHSSNCDPILYKDGYPDGIKFREMGLGPRFVVVTKSDVDFYSETETYVLIDHYIRCFRKTVVSDEERSVVQHYGRTDQHRTELALAIALRGQETIDFIDSFMKNYFKVELLRGRFESPADKEKGEFRLDIYLIEHEWGGKQAKHVYAPLNQDSAQLLLDILPFSKSPQALKCLRRLKKQCEKKKSTLLDFVEFAIEDWHENNPTEGND